MASPICVGELHCKPCSLSKNVVLNFSFLLLEDGNDNPCFKLFKKLIGQLAICLFFADVNSFLKKVLNCKALETFFGQVLFFK